MTAPRGHVVASEALERTTDRFDAFVEMRAAAVRGLASHQRVRVHVGTAEVLGKVVVLAQGAPPRGAASAAASWSIFEWRRVSGIHTYTSSETAMHAVTYQ